MSDEQVAIERLLALRDVMLADYTIALLDKPYDSGEISFNSYDKACDEISEVFDSVAKALPPDLANFEERDRQAKEKLASVEALRTAAGGDSDVLSRMLDEAFRDGKKALPGWVEVLEDPEVTVLVRTLLEFNHS